MSFGLNKVYLIYLTILFITRDLQAIDYRNISLQRNKFTCLKLDTSVFFNEIQRFDEGRNQNHTAPTAVMVMPADEAELPINWNYLVTEDQSVILLYGYPSEEDHQLEIDLIRYSLINPDPSIAGIRIVLEDENGSETDRSRAEDSQQVVELAFHQMSLVKFLLLDYWKSVNNIFSTSIWPQSHLASVGKHTKHGASVRIRVPLSQAKAIERLNMEINRATGAGNHRKLCQFKRSKTISIEHLFRSAGLYPDWCTFRLLAS